jgi:5-methylcytosine-specific restriction endonuclease McrA
MQDDSSIDAPLADRLDSLREEMQRRVARQEAYQRRRRQEVREEEARQEALEQQAALARKEALKELLLAYRMAKRKRWHGWLRKLARRRVAEIVLRDGYACRYCGTTTGYLDVDHVQPLSRGGTSDLENLALACQPCNRLKRSNTLDEWRGWRE